MKQKQPMRPNATKPNLKLVAAPIRDRRGNRLSREWLANKLMQAVDVGLAGTIFVVPWCMGGRHPLGELVLVCCALLAGLAWMARQHVLDGRITRSRSAADGLFLAAIALLIVQMLPLPSLLHEVLSPHVGKLLPLWSGDAASATQVGVWNCVTLTPDATRAALVLVLAYGLLFVTAVERIQKLEDIERMLRWISVSASVFAAFGIVQYLTSNGKFLWIYKHPFRHTELAATGMFINKNHFAHFLALAVGPLVWCLASSLRPSDAGGQANDVNHGKYRLAWLLALAVVLFAGLLSLSRGGIAAMVLAGTVTGVGLYRRGLIGRRALGGVLAVVMFIGCSLAVHGFSSVLARLDDYAAGSITELDKDGARRAIWAADARGVRDFFVLGAGVGSHREVYPMYLSEQRETEFTHADNCYLQVALEAGIPGLALIAAAISTLGVWCIGCWRQTESQRLFACATAISASLLVSAIHASIDLVWYVPSCVAIGLLLAACAFRSHLMSQSSAPVAWVLPRPLTYATAALAVVGGLWMLENRACATLAAPHWDAYLEFALSPAAQAGEVRIDADTVDHLESIVYWTPRDARAHMRLAGAYLSEFEKLQDESDNPMPLNQIRDAALASQFVSRNAQDEWLGRAIGSRRQFLDAAYWHAERGLQSCPLLGEGYVHLAQLWFLNQADAGAARALVDQALRVRPYAGTVLMSAGSEAALAGDYSSAMDFWRRAFHSGAEAQRQLIDLWARTQMPVEVVLAEFRPDLSATRLLDAKYSQHSLPHESRVVLAYYAELGEANARQQTGDTATRLWLEVSQVHARLRQSRQEIDALRTAVSLAPNDFDARWSLATALCEHHAFAEAEPHLRWCQMRQPDNRQIGDRLAMAVKGRIDATKAESSR